jgi:hypothetical protein
MAEKRIGTQPPTATGLDMFGSAPRATAVGVGLRIRRRAFGTGRRGDWPSHTTVSPARFSGLDSVPLPELSGPLVLDE